MKQRFVNFSREDVANFRNFIDKNNENTEIIISRLLLVLGFRPNLRGVKYLRVVILRCYQLPEFAKFSFSSDIYPVTASLFDTSARNIERDIRTAVQTCYNEGGLFKLNCLCSSDVISQQYPPTNSEFIMKSVAWLRTELDVIREM